MKNVYFFQPTGKLAERQSPYKEQVGVWGYDNFSGLYTASTLSAVFSYWYQNFDTRLQVLTNFFQELGANSLTAARYFENGTDGRPWESFRHSIAIQDGSSIAAAPAGSRRDLRLYIGGTDGTMKQYPYNVETNLMGTVTGKSNPHLAVGILCRHQLLLTHNLKTQTRRSIYRPAPRSA